MYFAMFIHPLLAGVKMKVQGLTTEQCEKLKEGLFKIVDQLATLERLRASYDDFIQQLAGELGIDNKRLRAAL